MMKKLFMLLLALLLVPYGSLAELDAGEDEFDLLELIDDEDSRATYDNVVWNFPVAL